VSLKKEVKEGFRSKVLKSCKDKALKNTDREKKQLGLGVSTRVPSTPYPTFCLSVYPMSFLNLQSPPVKPS
jgi:hypothetical protein